VNDEKQEIPYNYWGVEIPMSDWSIKMMRDGYYFPVK